MAKKSVKKTQAKRFALYWCTSPDGDEDWFVVVESAREACRFHEDGEGYDVGDADAERIMALPAELRVDGGWKDGAGARRASWRRSRSAGRLPADLGSMSGRSA
jgi:hypothetical protein